VNTALTGTTLSGYVDVSAQWNLGSQNEKVTSSPNGAVTSGTTPNYAFNSGKADGFNFNSIDLALDKPEAEGSWAAGYHAELMAGPDSVPGVGYSSVNSSGNNNSYATSATPGGVSVRQAYIALGTPIGNSRVDWKVGVFDNSIVGYESNSDPANPNYTRSYGYTMEPTTFTGILATYKVTDMLALQAGIADGYQVAEPGYAQNWTIGPTAINGRDTQETKKAYMGAITFTAPDNWGWMKGATLNAGVINNDNGTTYNATTMTDTFGTTSYYVGATVPTPLTGLKFGLAWDYLDFHDAHHIQFANSDSSQWNVGLYASYQANDNLIFNLRAEHLEYNVALQNEKFQGLANSDEFTATVQYKIWDNVLSRVEFRWDHTEHGTPFDNASNANVRGNSSGYGIHDNAFMLAANLIYQF